MSMSVSKANISRQASSSKYKLPSGTLGTRSSYYFGPHSSTSRHGRRKKKLGSALAKRGMFHVLADGGVDKTPKLLSDSDYPTLEEWQPTVLDYVEADQPTNSPSQQSLYKSYQTTLGSKTRAVSMLQTSVSTIVNMESYKEQTRATLGITESGSVGVGTATTSDLYSETAASAFRLRDTPSRPFYPPHAKVPIICHETNSFTLLAIRGCLENVDSRRGRAAEADNRAYEYLTVGQGKYSRKLSIAEQQTQRNLDTANSSLAVKYTRRNNWCWVTDWQLYDEWMGVVDTRRNVKDVPIEDQWQLVQEDERFNTAVLIMDRLLGNPDWRDLQLDFKYKNIPDPLNLEAQFIYEPGSLWKYTHDCLSRIAVTAIILNPCAPDIFAVGYGKYLYSASNRGAVCLWCVKNLGYPEKIYRFSQPVSCLDFAWRTPNMLAVGFLDGTLYVLDVSSTQKKILYQIDPIESNTTASILYVKWWIRTNIFHKEEEMLVAGASDGRVLQLRRIRDSNVLATFTMMRSSRLERQVKGIESLHRCDVEEITLHRHPAALSVVRSLVDCNEYLVATGDGAVHKCSINHFDGHIDVFLAHTGPVYGLRFSPFCNRIFMTFGADGAIRLWVYDISEPLITLTTGPVAVESAQWSTVNSTVIASISGPEVCFWDLRRKTYHPANTYLHPKNIIYTSLKFSKQGDNVLLGDIEGNIQILGLEGMPFQQIFKEDTLAISIEKELVVKSKLLKQLRKSGPPFTPIEIER